MRIQKTLSFFLALLCAASCTAAFAGCDKEKETGSETQTSGSTAESGTEKEEIPRFDYFSADMTQYASLKDYSQITVTLDESLQVNEAAIEKYIGLICEEYADIKKITDRPVEKGDTVHIYYEGYLDGEKFQGGSNMSDTEPYALVIGSGSFIPGFEDGLIGLIPSETGKDNLYDLPLTFPESYHSKELAGKAVIFKVYIDCIAESVPAEYTEDFITKTLKFEAKGDDIKGEFEDYIGSLLEENLANAVKEQIWQTVITNISVKEYPGQEVEFYYSSLISQYEYYMNMYSSYYGYKFEDLGDFVCQWEGYPEGTDWEAETQKQCENAVKQAIAYHWIAQTEGMEISDDDYKKAVDYYIDYYASSSGKEYTAEKIEEMVGKDTILSQALFEKVTDFLYENASVQFEKAEEETESTTETDQ